MMILAQKFKDHLRNAGTTRQNAGEGLHHGGREVT